jgi:hypothetical protein
LVKFFEKATHHGGHGGGTWIFFVKFCAFEPLCEKKQNQKEAPFAEATEAKGKRA